MGTTAEKLQAIVTAKADIGAAITEKGGTVPERFSEYGNAIRALPGGEPLDAQRVYAALRDTSWPPMPQDIPDHTVVMLLAPESSVDFSVTCEGQYTVTVQQCVLTDGQWIYTEELVENVDSAAAFAHAYTEADGSNFRLLTISGSAITAFTVTGASATNTVMPGVVEFLCKLPDAEMPVLSGMSDLVWVTELAELNTAKDGKINLFANCRSLIAVTATNITMNAGTNIGGMFRFCSSLLAINLEVTPTTTFSNLPYVFAGCKMLSSIPKSFLSFAGGISNTFSECFSLKSIEISNQASRSLSCKEAFSDCVRLEKVKLSGKLKPTQMNIGLGCFSNCISLQSLIFDLPNWTGSSFSIADCAFQRSGLVEMFQSLPTTTSSPNITLTGNPGVAELTDADKAIATDKGWTLTL